MNYMVMDKKEKKCQAKLRAMNAVAAFKREYWELVPYMELLTLKEGELLDASSGKKLDFAFSTDGEYLYYNVAHVLRSNEDILANELLHVLYHFFGRYLLDDFVGFFVNHAHGHDINVFMVVKFQIAVDTAH